MWCWGLKFKSWCLHGKYFTDWAISQPLMKLLSASCIIVDNRPMPHKFLELTHLVGECALHVLQSYLQNQNLITLESFPHPSPCRPHPTSVSMSLMILDAS